MGLNPRRGAPVPPRRRDRPAPVGRDHAIDNPSADRILREYQGLRVGDVVPDGEPGTAWYLVERLEPARLLVLHSTSHIPPALKTKRLGVAVNWTWTFVLEARPGGATRLLLRVRPRCRPWWFRALYHLLVVPSDFVMARSMLLGIKGRAEAAASEGWAAGQFGAPVPAA